MDCDEKINNEIHSENIFQKYFHFNIDILIFINDIYNINIYNNYLINNFLMDINPYNDTIIFLYMVDMV